jgi:hypothetical protein
MSTTTLVSYAAAFVLSLVALLARRPGTAASALLVSYLLATPLGVVSTTLNSAVYACDAVFLAILLRWGTRAAQRIRTFGWPPGTALLGVIGIIVLISRLQWLATDVSTREIGRFGFFNLRYAIFAATIILLARLPYDAGDYVRVVRWCCLLAIGLACGNVLSRLGVESVHFYSGYLVLEQQGIRAAPEDTQAATVTLLGFIRPAVGLFAYAGVVMLFLYVWLKGRHALPLLLIGLPLTAVLLLDSLSRAAILAAMVAAIVLLLRLRARQSLTLVAAGVLGIAAILLFVSDVSPWLERISGLFSRAEFARSTGSQRVADWMRLLDFLGRNPKYLLLGAGFLYYGGYRLIGATENSAGHNMYIHTLGELGVFGAIAWLVLWTILGVALYRASRRLVLEPMRSLIAKVVFAFYVGLVVSGLSQESLYPNPAVYCAVMFCFTLLATTFGALTGGPAGPWPTAAPAGLTAARPVLTYAPHNPVPLPPRQPEPAAHVQPD